MFQPVHLQHALLRQAVTLHLFNKMKKWCPLRNHLHLLMHQPLLRVPWHNPLKELQRSVSQSGVPAEPCEGEVHEHNATHIPFKAWSELCVAHKGRQDHHHLESHTSPADSVVSFDFDRGADSLTILLIHDRSTKMMHAVPTAAKGCRSLPYLEVVSFCDVAGPSRSLPSN